MTLQGRKLGILLSAPVSKPNFNHAVQLASAALDQGVDVYLYCIDEAVAGLTLKPVQDLRERGAKIFGCAFGAQKRNLQVRDEAVLGGLGIVSELMTQTDRFVSFN